MYIHPCFSPSMSLPSSISLSIYLALSLSLSHFQMDVHNISFAPRLWRALGVIWSGCSPVGFQHPWRILYVALSTVHIPYFQCNE